VFFVATVYNTTLLRFDLWFNLKMHNVKIILTRLVKRSKHNSFFMNIHLYMHVITS